jgi:hypothetical protein
MGTRNGIFPACRVMFRWFLDATDYWFGYSDTSSRTSTEGYDPARERFMVGIGNVVDGMNAMSCISNQGRI